MSADRHNLLHPTKPRRKSYSKRRSKDTLPVIAVDRLYAQLRRPGAQSHLAVLRRAGHRRLRAQRLSHQVAQFFEVNRYYVAVAALKALADDGS
jgi:pyruvate dehydrogenase E1 component